MVLFIPWRVVAEDCAAHLDLPWLAGGAVAGFLFSDIPVRGDDGARAIGATDDAAAVELPGRRRSPLSEIINNDLILAHRCRRGPVHTHNSRVTRGHL
jgi:hypothetical protein